ncbi:MAG TPA: glycyl-radical enzyme activating protein [Anaeromyxobacter sp.]|nr:glycyl-radical enzyme activating protein [Anaeromyxobacter sp.]
MGRIFDVQRFSVHDGPGIRSTLFLKGCPLRCLWCQNPEGLEGAIRLWHFANLCQRCGTCVEACPTRALSLTEDGIDIDRSRCDLCGKCIDACPRNALAFDGRDLTVDEAVTQLAADKVFYDRSGGGVTFSGGDPLLQADFVAAVARGLKARGIHTAIETSLFAPWASVEPLLSVIDLFIVDLKMSDPARHAELTGQDNALILANARRLAKGLAGSGRLLLRVPLVPRFTAGPENLSAIAALAASIDPTAPVELMNFNPLAAAKYRRMHREHALAGEVTSFNERELAAFREVFERRGLRVR